MKIIITIEARIGSTRLPGKVLKEVSKKPLLQHMIERLKRSQKAHDVVVATTTNPQDDAIEKLCQQIDCSYFRGSEPDITERLLGAATHHQADLIVQTTGDCPLHDPRVIDLGIDVYLNSQVDYVSNRLKRSWPTGLDTQIYAPNLLEKVARKTQDPTDREHGSYYIYTHPDEFTLKNYESEDINCPEKRWCLDYPEDYAFIKDVFEKLYPQKTDFDTYDVLKLLENEPHLESLNKMHPCDLTAYDFHESC